MSALADVSALSQTGNEIHSAAERARRQERVAQSVIRGILYAVPALLCAYAACVSDPDIWWHLRSGEWMMQHHAIPHTDPFSSVGAGKPWAAYSWLFELIVLRLYQSLGFAGIVVYTSGMVLAITVALHHLLKRLHSDFTVVVLLTLAASLSLERLYTPRPWHFTILFFVLELNILLQARRTGRVRDLAWLPLIFAIWANVHIQFVDGLLVLGMVAAEGVVGYWWSGVRQRVSGAWMVAVFGACVLATLVNPYGWGIYRAAYDLAAQPGVMDHISELQAIPFRGLPDWCVLGLALGAAAVLARARRLQVFEVALLGVAVFLAFRSQRDVWILAVVASAAIAGGIGAGERTEQTQKRGPAVLSGLLTACIAALLLGVGFRAMHVDNARLSTDLAKDLPVDAVKAVKAAGYPGPVYNDYVWGGYLIWSLRMPVSIDGRAALQGTERMNRFESTWNASPDWRTDKELAAAGIVIGPVKAPLVQVLRIDSRFRLAYEDKVAAVFIPAR